MILLQELIIGMYSVNSNVIYKTISSCDKDHLLPEELRYRGILTLLEYISRDNFNSDKIYLDYIFFRRLDRECRDMFKELFSSLYSRKKDILDEFITEKLKMIASHITGYKTHYKDSKSVLLTDIFDKSASSIETLYKYLKRVINDLTLIHIPQLSYLLNIISLVPSKKYLDSLKTIFSDISLPIIFLDSYDEHIFNELNIGFLKASSISSLMKNLVFNMNVYLEKAYDMNIGIIKTCSSVFEKDYENYMEIIGTMANIHVIPSRRCIASGYFNYIQRTYRNNILFFQDFIDLFENTDLKIILTYDPYLYEYLVEYFKRKTYVIGFLPNLIMRFMRKIS